MTDIVKINNTHLGKIGDTVVTEPALTAYAERNNKQIHYYVGKDMAPLFTGHPYITTSEHPFKEPDLNLSVDRAFFWSHEHDMPFSAGFFNQIGIDPTFDHRLWYRSYWLDKARVNPIAAPRVDEFAGANIVVPYGYSCTSRKDGIVDPNSRPNVQPPVAWWESIIDKLDGPTFAVMGSNTEWNPDFPYAANVRDLNLYQLLMALSVSKLVITVETGIAHLCSTARCKTIFLSCATPISFVSPIGTRHETIRPPASNCYADAFDPNEVLDAVRRIGKD